MRAQKEIKALVVQVDLLEIKAVQETQEPEVVVAVVVAVAQHLTIFILEAAELPLEVQAIQVVLLEDLAAVAVQVVLDSVHLDHRAVEVVQDQMAHRAHQAQVRQQEILAQKEILVHPEIKVLQAIKVFRAIKAHRDQLEHKVRLVHRAIKVFRAIKAHKAQLGQKEIKVLQEMLELKVLQEQQEIRAAHHQL